MTASRRREATLLGRVGTRTTQLPTIHPTHAHASTGGGHRGLLQHTQAAGTRGPLSTEGKARGSLNPKVWSHGRSVKHLTAGTDYEAPNRVRVLVVQTSRLGAARQEVLQLHLFASHSSGYVQSASGQHLMEGVTADA